MQHAMHSSDAHTGDFAATQRASGRAARDDLASADEQPDALPAGTRLDEFEIVRVLGAGGFGIVYLAMDHALLRQVAIKEYMPCELARRGEGTKLTLHSSAHAHTFAAGLQSFIKEAQLLASFDHPSLLKVYRFWEGNGTAYMVMPFYAGRTLKQERIAMGRPPDEAMLRRLVDPLLGALDAMHSQGVFHRDIAPDNIIIQPDGTPVLLDFGAARRVIGDRTQALTAVFKPNFAPVEQYADVPGMKQGPWTDLYALGAVVHYLLTGQPPVPAVVRAVHDHMPALSAGNPPLAGLSAGFARAIDWALGVRSDERPQSVKAMRDALDGSIVPPPPTRRLPADASAGGAERSSPVTLAVGAAAGPATPAVAPVTAALGAQVELAAAAGDSPAPPNTVPASGGRLRRSLAAVALAIVLAGGIGWLVPHVGEAAGDRSMSTPILAAEPAAAKPDAGKTAPTGKPAAKRLPPAGAGAATPTAGQGAKGQTHSAAPATTSARQPIESQPPGMSPSGPAESSPRGTTRTMATVREEMTAPRSPREACGDRNFLSMNVCMNRQCRDPAYARHPQCVEFRAHEEARREAEAQLR
jgi:serine/threonine protein kinase